MKYKVYHKSTGFITGILPLDGSVLDETVSSYESQIDYDDFVEVDSDLSEQEVFFGCTVGSDGIIIPKESDERKTIRELTAVRYNRKDEYPDIGEQLDMLYHAIDSDSDLKTKFSTFYTTIKSVKDKYPKTS